MFLKELLTANSSDKIVVVSQFVDVILKISEVLTSTHIPFETCKFLFAYMKYTLYDNRSLFFRF